jgi:hypothetical protein
MDYSLPVRRAILPAMKDNDALTDLIPEASIYGATVPIRRTFPFARYGAPIATPFRLSGLNSSSIRVTIHAFTGPVADGGEAAEDLCWRMAAAIKTALDGRALALEEGMTATVAWVGSNCIVDRDEASAWHAIVNFQVDVAG